MVFVSSNGILNTSPMNVDNIHPFRRAFVFACGMPAIMNPLECGVVI